MKQIVTRGIVLTRTNFGEADRIITILTSDQGKIRLVAKGVRRIKSRLAGGIELFSVNDITYIQGKGDLGTLISSRLITNYSEIVKNVDRTMYMYDVLKTVHKLTEDAPGSDYFDLLQICLESVNNPGLDLDLLRLWLNMQLLRLAGYSPNLETDQEGNALQSGSKFTFSFDDMGFAQHPAGLFEARSVKLLRLVQRASSPRQLMQITDVSELLPSLVQLTKAMLTQRQSAA